MLLSLAIAISLQSCAHRVKAPTLPKEVVREAHSDASVLPVAYRVRLDLDPDKEDFRGEEEIRIRLSTPSRSITLNSRGLKILAASFLQSTDVAIPLETQSGDEDTLILRAPEDFSPGELTLRFSFSGKTSDSEVAGIFRRKLGDSWAIFTQFEPQDARAAFPCFDSPEFKTPFELEINAPQGYMALSNTSGVAKSVGGGKTKYAFPPTVPLPTYLVALSVGRFDILPVGTTASGAPVRLVIPPGQKSKAKFAADFTPRAVESLERYFALPYAFPKLDLLAVPSFPGAMENAGLITFNERTLVRDPAQTSFYDREMTAAVIAHELSHQWFGNYVTMATWQDLWLNEGFATWLESRIVEGIFPDWHAELGAFDEFSQSMSIDRLKQARRIREPAKSRSEVLNAFDGITYGKTAAVLRMFESWIGPERFRDSIRKYIAAHPFGTLASKDFLQQLETDYTPGIAKAFESFLDQAGVPLLSAKTDCGSGLPTFRLSQSRYLPLGSKASPVGKWGLPYCIRFAVSGQKPQRQCGVLENESAAVPVDGGRCPAWFYPNAGGYGYYYSNTELAELKRLLAEGWSELSPLERRALLRDVRAAIDAGKTLWGEFFNLLPEVLDGADNDIVLLTLDLSRLSEYFLDASNSRAYRAFMKAQYQPFLDRLGIEKKDGEDIKAELLRIALLQTIASQARDKKTIAIASRFAHQWMDDTTSVSSALKPFVLSNGLQNNDHALWKRVKEAAVASTDQSLKTDYLNLLRSVDSAPLIIEQTKLIFSDKISITESFPVMEAALNNGNSQKLAWHFLKGNINRIIEKTPESRRLHIIESTENFCSFAMASDVERFFTPLLPKIEGGERALSQTVESIQLCAALIAFQKKSITKTFHSASSPSKSASR